MDLPNQVAGKCKMLNIKLYLKILKSILKVSLKTHICNLAVGTYFSKL